MASQPHTHKARPPPVPPRPALLTAANDGDAGWTTTVPQPQRQSVTLHDTTANTDVVDAPTTFHSCCGDAPDHTLMRDAYSTTNQPYPCPNCSNQW